MLRWKIDIISALDMAGYPVSRIKSEKLIGVQTYYDMKKDGKVCGIITLDTICRILECQPGMLIKYVPDDSDPTDELPPV